MEDINICSHSKVTNDICKKCSSLVYKRTSSIKLNRYKAIYEQNPNDLIENIKFDNYTFHSGNNFKTLEHYTTYRLNILSSFKKLFYNRYKEDTFYLFVHLMDYIVLKDNIDSERFSTVALGSFILASIENFNLS
jgi:hypothetical protein